MKGFEKPAVQWAVVAASALLAALLVSATMSVRESASRLQEMSVSQRACQSDLQSADAQLAKERAAREAFSLELARVRAEGSGDTASSDVPTLTLVPPREREPVPPDATVTALDRAQVIQLRLVLPANAAVKDGGLRIAARDWSTGRAIWSLGTAGSTTADGRRAVVAHVTGEMLGPGSYEIWVMPDAPAGSTEPVATYELTIGH